MGSWKSRSRVDGIPGMAALNAESVFRREQPLKPAPWDRLLGRQPTENALIALINLFSEEHPLAVTYEEIQNIVQTYRLRRDVFKRYAAYVYRGFLEYYVKDRRISDDDILVLRHLKDILSLNDHDVGRLQKEVTQTVFRSELLKVIEDEDWVTTGLN